MNPMIRNGRIYVYRVFDIAEEVSLPLVERILSQKMGEGRLRLAEKTRDAVVVRNAPLRMNLGDVALGESSPIAKRADVIATIWDYGVLSISFQISLGDSLGWNDLMALSALLNSNSELLSVIDLAARTRAKDLCDVLSPALKRPELWSSFEDYIIYFMEKVDGVDSPADLLKKAKVSELLVGEAKEVLSDLTREPILQNVYQYTESDLVIIDWNSALVIEPGGPSETNDVLEFALTHLLEVRFYDDLIDRRLADLYDRVELDRGRIFRNQFGSISKEANTRFLEFSEFMERMGNSLKVVGDFYLARLFRGAIRRFRISDWEQNITRKMNLLAQVSQLLQGEVHVRRSHLLELIIIVLILFEIVSAMFKGIGS